MSTRHGAVAVGAVAAVVAAGGWWARAAGPGGGRPPFRYLKSAEDVAAGCAGCHRQPLEDHAAKPRESHKFVLLREFVLWEQHDPHRRAYDGLTGPLGRRMGEVLYGDPAAVTRQAACLVCHATDTAPETPLAAKAVDQFDRGLGVNCQACHGPAKEWVGPHWQLDWREKAAADKQANFGLVNLRDPAVRAARCASCHVGSAADGKCVTHAMYAAGHPPLPAFELATFSRDEPRHWRSAADVPYITQLAKKDPPAARDRFAYRPGEVEAARLVAAGAVAAVRQSARLLQFDPDPRDADGGLDLTHFNCAACHHDLRVPSDRQRAGYPGVPGRPVPRTWPLVLARVVADHAAAGRPTGADRVKRFEAAVAALHAGFDARPFGDKAAVRRAADDVLAACDDLDRLVDETAYPEAAARDLLRRIADRATAPPAGRGRYLDADAGYQLARAFAAVYTDLAGAGYDRAVPPKGPPAFGMLTPDPLNLSAALARLDAAAPLAVRARYVNGIPSARGQAGDEGVLQADLAARLRAYYGYDVDEFRAAFAAVRDRLNGR